MSKKKTKREKEVYCSEERLERLKPLQGLTLEEMTQTFLKANLDWCGGDRKAAARVLGLSERTLYRLVPARVLPKVEEECVSTPYTIKKVGKSSRFVFDRKSPFED